MFDDCKVPAENLIGHENLGVAVVMSGLDLERAFLATAAIGLGERALQLSLEYAKQRQQFGRPIAHFQMIQAKLCAQSNVTCKEVKNSDGSVCKVCSDGIKYCGKPHETCKEVKNSDGSVCKVCSDGSKKCSTPQPDPEKTCYDTCLKKGDSESTCKNACYSVNPGKACYDKCVKSGKDAASCKKACTKAP